DIKPSNILVTSHDGTPVPKVIDFGIAKATNQQRLTDLTVFTAFEQFIGTPAYMSPEQAEMSGLDIDTRSDLYSLGVLLYELLTGKTPFDSKDLLAAGLDELRRNKLVVAAATAVGTVLVLGILASTWQAVRATRAEQRAVQEARRASTAATQAKTAEKVAVEKSSFAEEQRLRAEEQVAARRLLSYVAEVNLAQNYCREGNFSQALALLKGHRPKLGETDLRGFEWRHLWRLCRG